MNENLINLYFFFSKVSLRAIFHLGNGTERKISLLNETHYNVLANWRFRGAVHISMVNRAFIILSGFRYIENVELFIASLQLKDLINFETSVSNSITRCTVYTKSSS